MVTFTLSSGQVRRYKRLCELIQSMIMAPGHVTSTNVVIGRKISSDLASDASELSMDNIETNERTRIHTIPGIGLSTEVPI